MSILLAYLKYIALYVIFVPAIIILIQGGNFGGLLLFGWMLIIAPVLSLTIPRKIIRIKNIEKKSTVVLLYIVHITIALVLQLIAIMLVVYKVFGTFSMI